MHFQLHIRKITPHAHSPTLPCSLACETLSLQNIAVMLGRSGLLCRFFAENMESLLCVCPFPCFFSQLCHTCSPRFTMRKEGVVSTTYVKTDTYVLGLQGEHVHTLLLTHTWYTHTHTHDGAEDGDRDIGLQGVIEL